MKNVTSDEKCWICPSKIWAKTQQPSFLPRILWELAFRLWPSRTELDPRRRRRRGGGYFPCWWRGWDGQKRTEEMMPAGNKLENFIMNMAPERWRYRKNHVWRVPPRDENAKNHISPRSQLYSQVKKDVKTETAGTQDLASVSRGFAASAVRAKNRNVAWFSLFEYFNLFVFRIW